jgi:hypothetical protein
MYFIFHLSIILKSLATLAAVKILDVNTKAAIATCTKGVADSAAHAALLRLVVGAVNCTLISFNLQL